MKKTLKPALLGLVTLAVAGSFLLTAANASFDAPSAPAPARADKQFIGAAKCKNCHDKEESGNQYGAWQAAGHSKAFEALGKPEAVEAAATRGVEPKTEACLKCHTTAHGAPEGAIKKGFDAEAGVQCETCHGPGSEHLKARFAAAASGETPAGYQGVAVEEMITSPSVEVCTACHNPESPTYEAFCYYEMRGKIAHLDPRKPRTDEERANFGVCPHGAPCPHAEGCPDGTCNLTPEQLAAFKQ